MRRLAIVMCLWLAGIAGARAEPTASIAGVVTSGGKPLGKATVMVNHAFPIKGLAYCCPSCYRDCGKSVETDAEGKWSLTGLDDTLKFDLLVFAKGHIPKVTPVMIPAKGEPVDVELVARDLESVPAARVVRGRVVDTDGRPLKGAVVVPDMVWMADGTGCGGACDGLDQLAVTDEDGRFALAHTKACSAMDLGVSARGFAKVCFPGRASGGADHELRVVEGASVSGQLVRDGKPVPDVEITLVTDQSRGSRRICFDRQTLATDSEGRFFFAGVLPGQQYVLSASTEQLRVGCMAPVVVPVKNDGEDIDAGQLPVVRGVRVSGRVLPPEGGKIPAGAKLTLSSSTGWDGVTIDLAEDGSFAFPEMYKGSFRISLHAPGIYISHRNASVDKLNPNSMVGSIESDLRGLEIETTTERPRSDRRGEAAEPRELGGIEGKKR